MKKDKNNPINEGKGIKKSGSKEDEEVEDISKNMHYRNSQEKPKYLFGEAPQKVSVKTAIWDSKVGENVKAKGNGTKIEELITRSEARKVTSTTKQDNVTVLTIDSHANTNPSGERPLFLPVKKTVQQSPPPITPILSPPPAFQDTKNRNKAKAHLAVTENEKPNPKGMVFSRSFEYDSRNKLEYKEVTSKSFDYDLQPRTISNIRNMRRDKSPIFSTLTGISPSYLTKRPTPEKSPIFPKAIPGSSVNNNFASKLATSGNNNGQQVQILGQYKSLDVEGVARSRRGQFTRTQMSEDSKVLASGNPTSNNYNNYRNFGDNTIGGNQRLNSCDSGARSGTIRF